ncbi:hypothetical protein SAMN05216518_12630 [Bacteroidales bacterium KHT7]|jgi:hypothetical protein|nr:hypothetical protein SAMN05216518_12630 [Bacteroidales bacterium KHT7]
MSDKYVKPEVYVIEMKDVVLVGASQFDLDNPPESGDIEFNSKSRNSNGGGMWKYMED